MTPLDERDLVSLAKALGDELVEVIARKAKLVENFSQATTMVTMAIEAPICALGEMIQMMFPGESEARVAQVLANVTRVQAMKFDRANREELGKLIDQLQREGLRK